MLGKEKHYFACANTAVGFYNLFDSNLQGLDKIYILKGGPGCGKSTMMKQIGNRYQSFGYDVEYIHCSGDPDSLDGLLIRKLGVGIVDGTAPHVIEPKAAGAIEEYVNLGASWDTDLLAESTDTILLLQKDISEDYQKAYELFAKAIKVHDEWENIYIKEMNFEEADNLSKFIISMILGEAEPGENGVTYHRFFGGSTHKGPIDYVESLTADIKTRYFVKGRPGSGKSTMLKKLLKAAQEKKLCVEVYHCGLDPNSLDMIVLPSLDVCIFDSTAPHEYHPGREDDIVIDMYGELITPGTDEKYEAELDDIKVRYRQLISEAIEYLADAKKLHDDLEEYYTAATEFAVIDTIISELVDKIDHRL